MYISMTWHRALSFQFESNGESWGDVEWKTISDEELMREFDGGYGSLEGEPFILWTKKRVYFSCQYDGSEYVQSVPRNPDPSEEPSHI